MDRLAEVEARLDTAPLQRGRRVADLVTVAVVATVAIATGWTIVHPLLLLGLLLAATGLNRGIPYVRRRALRRERERLTALLEGVAASGLTSPIEGEGRP